MLVQTDSLSSFVFGLMTLQSVKRWKWVGKSIRDGEEIRKRESAGTHVIFFFFKLLRHFSPSFSTLSLPVPLLNGCMTAKKVILGKFSPPFQQKQPFLRWPAPACLGPLSLISLPFLIFFKSTFSFFLCTHSHFLVFKNLFLHFIFNSSHNSPHISASHYSKSRLSHFPFSQQ